MVKIIEDPWTTQKVEKNASGGIWTNHTNTITTPRGEPCFPPTHHSSVHSSYHISVQTYIDTKKSKRHENMFLMFLVAMAHSGDDAILSQPVKHFPKEHDDGSLCMCVFNSGMLGTPSFLN